MSVAAPDIARVLFWILAVAVVFLPRRWALLAYLVIIQVDVSGPGWASPTAVGLENGIKVVALPLILLVRTSSWELLTYWTRPLKLWLLFTAYVALAGLWSPYPISAIKMVGYLLAYAVIFLVFAQAWRQRLLDMKQVIAALWLSLLLAVIQSYLLGNAFGAPPKLITEQARFTTFAPPQSYAAFLLSCGVLLLFVRRGISGSLWNIALCLSGAAVAAGLLLVASRYVTVGALTLLVVAGFARIQPQLRGRTIDRAMLVKPALLSLTALILLFSSAAIVAPDNRIFALREMVAHGHFNPDAIGTFAWRLGVYRTAIDQIEARNPVEDVVGSGTSSGAKVILEFNPTAFHANTIDANRSLHDEFLRAFYEWGIIGEALFLAFLGSLVMGLVRQTRAAGFETTWPFWGLLPTLGLGLLVENVLAGSGTPVGTGFVLVIAYVAVAATFTAREAEVVRARSGRTQFLPATGR